MKTTRTVTRHKHEGVLIQEITTTQSYIDVDVKTYSLTISLTNSLKDWILKETTDDLTRICRIIGYVTEHKTVVGLGTIL